MDNSILYDGLKGEVHDFNHFANLSLSIDDSFHLNRFKYIRKEMWIDLAFEGAVLSPVERWMFNSFIIAFAEWLRYVLSPHVRVNTYKGLILAAIGWPFGVFLMKQFAQTIPGELIEAAKIDGSSEIRLFGTIILPLLKPAVGALAIFTFITSSND